MGIVSALVLFAMIWFMTLFVALPIGLRTQGDVGEVVPGTHAGAPANLRLKRKLLWVTLFAFLIWVVVAGTIISGAISVRDFDWFERMGPASQVDGTGG